MRSFSPKHFVFCGMSLILGGCQAQNVLTMPERSVGIDGTDPGAGGYKVLYEFKGGKDGELPLSRLAFFDGKLYGTTSQGGDASCAYKGCGTVFELGLGGTMHTLHRFGGTDGAFPFAGLTVQKGSLYGTTLQGGGIGNAGAVYAISPAGQERLLYDFAESGDGRGPSSDLIYVKGAFYGTTRFGGYGGCYLSNSCGTAFKVTLSGKESLLHTFKPSLPPKDGVWPYVGLTLLNKTLYGTTGYGGAKSWGTVFTLTLGGKEKVLYSFQGGHDGAYPFAQLTLLNGEFYGTTAIGGAYGFGTVFAISPAGKERVIYAFKGSPGDGAGPSSQQLISVNGNLYGTTFGGGVHECFSSGTGCGTVFMVTRSGKETVLHSFKGGSDGSGPSAGLVDVGGVLYGTTESGGSVNCSATRYYSAGCGTVFEISP